MSVAEQFKTFENRISKLEKEKKLLLEAVHHLIRKLYGRSSEKTSVLTAGQMSLFYPRPNQGHRPLPLPQLPAQK